MVLYRYIEKPPYIAYSGNLPTQHAYISIYFHQQTLTSSHLLDYLESLEYATEQSGCVLIEGRDPLSLSLRSYLKECIKYGNDCNMYKVVNALVSLQTSNCIYNGHSINKLLHLNWNCVLLCFTII